MRRVKKLPFAVPNCITKLPGGDMWHDSKTGDKVHATKLEVHIKKHYGEKVLTAIKQEITKVTPERKPYSGRTVGNYREAIVSGATNDAFTDGELKDELIRSRRYDLRGDD